MKEWIKKKIGLQGWLKSLPTCEVENCGGKAMGSVLLGGRSVPLCPQCAATALRQLETAEKPFYSSSAAYPKARA